MRKLLDVKSVTHILQNSASKPVTIHFMFTTGNAGAREERKTTTLWGLIALVMMASSCQEEEHEKAGSLNIFLHQAAM